MYVPNNRFNFQGPFNSPDGVSGGGPTGGPEELGPIEQEIASRFELKIMQDADKVLGEILQRHQLHGLGHEVSNDSGKLEITPKKKSKLVPWAKTKTLPPEIEAEFLNLLNSHYDAKEGLGKFTLKKEGASYVLNFESSADVRDMQRYLLADRNHVSQMTAVYAPKEKKITKKDAFLLYQTLNLVEGSGYANIRRQGSVQDTNRVKIVFHNLTDADKFLEGLDDDLKEMLSFSAEKALGSQNVVEIKFDPDWENDSVYSKYQSLSSTDINRVVSEFRVTLIED